MYHSLTFGTVSTGDDGITRITGKNTWDDWHLIPSSRPSAALPEPNTNAVDIPFRDGALDISEAVTGYMTYKDRAGSWEFYIANDYHYWVALKREITNYLHGRKMCVVFEDDPGFYYEGRLSVDEFQSQQVNSTITIAYTLRPYKLSMVTTGEKWLWDPFSFVDGVINSAVDQTVPCAIKLHGGRMRAGISVMTTNSGCKVSLNGGTPVTLNQGVTRLPDMILEDGENTLVFTGSGYVTVTYREGSL